MRHIYHFFRRGYLLIWLFLFSSVAYGQWQADFTNGSSLEERGWRRDVAYFKIKDGRLSLSSVASMGERAVVHSVRLSERNRWQGRVQLDRPSTVRNHAYVLLYAFDQNREEKLYRYVALSVGGGRKQSVSLVSVDLEVKEGGGFALRREKELIAVDVRTSAPSTDVSFDVRLDEQGTLRLNVRDNRRRLMFSGSALWQKAPSGGNSLGFLCLHTKTYAEAMHLSNLSLTHEWDAQLEFPEVTPEDSHSLIPEEEVRMPIITEVMVNPDARYDEYVELYNPNNEEMELDGVYLGIGRNRGHLRFVSLDNLSPIPAKGYVVLTQTPNLLLEAFPSADASKVFKVNLPAMSNSGCSIALRVMGEIVDYIDYSSSLHDKGLMSKRGIALERTALSDVDFSTSIWRSASKEKGYATPTRANSRFTKGEGGETRGDTSGDKEDLFDFIRMVEEHPGAELRCSAYSIDGLLLYRSEHTQARELLGGLKSDGFGTINTIAPTYRGVVLLVFDYMDREEVERYVLKVMRY